jgi:hypothetical protein
MLTLKRCLISGCLASLVITATATAKEIKADLKTVVGTSAEWVESPNNHVLPGQEQDYKHSKTYFSTKFGKRSGTFRASYRRLSDKRDTVSGTFLVAKFRYVSPDKPMGSGGIYDPHHDDYIATVLLNCAEEWSGVIGEFFALNGNVISNISLTDPSLNQGNRDGTTIGDLCQFAKQQGQW